MIANQNCVRVIHGANADDFNVAGSTVESVFHSLTDAFNIPADVLAFVNGVLVLPASLTNAVIEPSDSMNFVVNDYRLHANDTLEFVYPFGQKGGKPWGRDHVNADPDDFYPTPPHAVRSLLENEHFGTEVWEPACGNGAISKVLKAAGYKVLSTDIVNRGYGREEDFITSKRSGIESIVTNPPFSLAEEFVSKSLDVTTNKVAMLLRLSFLESQRRYRLFKDTPLESVYVFSRRLTMHRGGVETEGNGAIAYAWYVWRHGYHGEPRLRWFEPDARF